MENSAGHSRPEKGVVFRLVSEVRRSSQNFSGVWAMVLEQRVSLSRLPAKAAPSFSSLSYFESPPALTPEYQAIIDADRKELLGDFCRGCGYCAPCTVGIVINQCTPEARSPAGPPRWAPRCQTGS